MTQFLLTVDQAAANSDGYDEVFLWTRAARCSFTGALDPHLTSFGRVRQANIDFVRLALGVFSADRSTPRRRGGADWNSRELGLTVEMGDPEPWNEHAAELSRIVGFLTGDRWTLGFTQAIPNPVEVLPIDDPPPDQTVLLSGGADSAAGALLSALDMEQRQTLQLVSHFSASSISPFQKALVKRTSEHAPEVVLFHSQTNLNRRSRRLHGTRYRSEPSSRSRSLLFLSLGLAAAERSGRPLLIPENGFASLNPPLGPERRGALSTHTTHPRFLGELQAVLGKISAHGLIENPFARQTKGEMFAEVATRIGTTQASEYLSATNSCSHTDARYSRAPAGSSCGVCFGCLVRRASFHAAGIADATTYLCNDPGNRYARFVAEKSIVEAMHDFVADDPQPKMVMTMSLPDDYAASDALDLCRRGVQELRKSLS